MMRSLTAATVALLSVGLVACQKNGAQEETQAQPAAVNAPAGENEAPQPSLSMLSVNEAAPYGTFVTDASGRSLYMNSGEINGQISCTGECTEEWLPFVLTGTAGTAAPQGGAAAGEAGAENGMAVSNAQGGQQGMADQNGGANQNAMATQSGGTARGLHPDLLGTIQRPDGRTQVTYGGHPLYYYRGDQAPGDVKGQDLMDAWYLVGPTGEKVESGRPADGDTTAGSY